jgi:hypothetical protein
MDKWGYFSVVKWLTSHLFLSSGPEEGVGGKNKEWWDDSAPGFFLST